MMHWGMWGRWCEILCGVWLIASPWVFQPESQIDATLVNDVTSGVFIIVLALLSWVPRLRHAHLGNIAVALWLMGFAYFASPYPSPLALQNEIFTGLLLLMFALIPNRADIPPLTWTDFNESLKLP